MGVSPAPLAVHLCVPHALPPDPVPEDVWRRLVSEGHRYDLDTREPLWEPAQERPSRAYVVSEGLVRLYHPNRQGKAITVVAVGRGGLLGYHPQLSGSPYATGAEAMTLSRLLGLRGEELDRWFQEGDELGEDFREWLRRDLDLHMRNTYTRLQLDNTSAEEKVARMLLALHEQNLLTSITRRQIAELTNLSAETVVRVLSKLRREETLEKTEFTLLSENERHNLCDLLTPFEPLSLPYS